ncbi:MAG: hypothetical protein K6F66_07355 [Pseudobutyrivibrio sp.]|nr:hypothetical protein [Pseudobutyrivibrio sp.]
MEMKDIIDLVEEVAIKIAQEEIVRFSQANPEVNLQDSDKEQVLTRSISQLTLQLSKFHFKNDEDLKDQFLNWFEESEEEDLRKACRHCLEDQAKTIHDKALGNLTSLDSYLRKHLGDIHQID